MDFSSREEKYAFFGKGLDEDVLKLSENEDGEILEINSADEEVLLSGIDRFDKRSSETMDVSDRFKISQDPSFSSQETAKNSQMTITEKKKIQSSQSSPIVFQPSQSSTQGIFHANVNQNIRHNSQRNGVFQQNKRGRGGHFNQSYNRNRFNRSRTKRSDHKFSLLTTRKFLNIKNEYLSEKDTVYTSGNAPKILIMKEDLSSYFGTEITQVREAIEDAILRENFDTWAPKMEEGCLLGNYACEIICLTRYTAIWMLSCDFGKVGDKALKVVRNGDSPVFSFKANYKGHLQPRPNKDFLSILAKQNPDSDLNVVSWFITNSCVENDGSISVFIRMSLKSARYLIDVKKNVLNFGVRLVKFYESGA